MISRRRRLAALALACCCALTGGSSSAPRPAAKAAARKERRANDGDDAPAKPTVVVRCLALKERGGQLEPMRFTLDEELDPKEVEIVVHACALSRSDLQAAADEDAAFPLVPGREIIGHVAKAGSAVSSVRPGQRVGVGLQMGDVDGDVLVKQAPVSVGGLADRIRVRSRWAFPIPDALPTDQAAPLMGAGAVCWSHLQRAKLKRGAKVGVIGLGGIGHLAVQFASRMGYAVDVIGGESDRAHNEEDAAQLGSSAFVALSDADARKGAARSYDLLLCTLDQDELRALGLKWGDCLKMLKSDAKFCVACESAAEVSSLPMKAMLERRLVLQTSAAITRNSAKEMLRFCERHRVCSLTEKAEMDADGARKALQRVSAADVRYRIVLLRSSAMQAYTLQRRDGLVLPGFGSVPMPALPVPARLRRATDSMLSQSAVLVGQLATRSRDMLANATSQINSSALHNSWQAAASAVRTGAQSLANSSDSVVRQMLDKGKGVLQAGGAKGAAGKGKGGVRALRGRQVGGSIGTLPSTVRPPDAAIASALKQKRAALAAARMSTMAVDEDDDADDADDADEAEEADEADEEAEEAVEDDEEDEAEEDDDDEAEEDDEEEAADEDDDEAEEEDNEDSDDGNDGAEGEAEPEDEAEAEAGAQSGVPAAAGIAQLRAYASDAAAPSPASSRVAPAQPTAGAGSRAPPGPSAAAAQAQASAVESDDAFAALAGGEADAADPWGEDAAAGDDGWGREAEGEGDEAGGGKAP